MENIQSQKTFFLLKSPLGGGNSSDDDGGAGRGGGIVRHGAKKKFGQEKKMLSAIFLTPAETKILMLLSASVKRFGVSRRLDFFFFFN